MHATKDKRIALIILLAVSYGSSPSLGQTKAERGAGDQEQKQPKVTPTKGKAPAKTKIDFDVFRRLERSGDGRVYVMVTLKPLPKEAVSDQQRKSGAKKSRDELAGRMTTGEFEFGYGHELDPILFGDVNAAGLKKLERDPNVEAVQFKVLPSVHRRLKERPGEFVHVLVAVRLSDEDTQKVDELEMAVNQAHDSASAELELAALKRFVDRIRDRVLSELAPGSFKLQYGSPFDADAWGLARSTAIEQLTKRLDVEAIAYIREEENN